MYLGVMRRCIFLGLWDVFQVPLIPEPRFAIHKRILFTRLYRTCHMSWMDNMGHGAPRWKSFSRHFRIAKHSGKRSLNIIPCRVCCCPDDQPFHWPVMTWLAMHTYLTCCSTGYANGFGRWANVSASQHNFHYCRWRQNSISRTIHKSHTWNPISD